MFEHLRTRLVIMCALSTMLRVFILAEEFDGKVPISPIQELYEVESSARTKGYVKLS